MKNLFSKYQIALTTIFCLWLLLVVIKKFGFSFGVSLSVFFRIFLFLFVIWLVWLARIKRIEIYAIIRKIWEEAKDEFIIETKNTQKQVIRFFPRFLTSKISGSLSFFLVFVFTLFLLPWRLTKKFFKKYVFNQITLLFLAILGIFLDIFIFKFSSDLVILFLTGLWILLVRRYKFESKVSIAGALIFLIMCPFLLIFHWDVVAEKSAIWAYMFLVMGVVQMFIEYLREERKGAKKEE